MKNKLFSKFVSLLIILTMIMTTFVGGGVTAMAGTGTPGKVYSASIKIDEALFVPGVIYKNATHGTSAWTVENPSSCIVEKVEFYNNDHVAIAEGSKIEYGSDTIVKLTLKLTEGTFADLDDLNITVNGRTSNVLDGWNSDTLTVEQVFLIDAETIYDISLSDLPDAVAGEAIKPYSYTHKEDGKTIYTVTGNWQVWNDLNQSYEATSDSTFAEGKIYRLALDAQTTPGYIFSEYITVYMNDELWDGMIDYNSTYNLTMYFLYPVGLDIISEIEIPEEVLSAATVGKKFTNTTITVPAYDDRYTLEGYWADDYGNYEGTFTKGKNYHFIFTGTAKSGYYFNEQLLVKAGDNYTSFTSEGLFVNGNILKTLKTPIDEVILTNVPEAKIGSTVKAGEIDVTVPSGAKYKAVATWHDNLGPIEQDKIIKEGDVYELYVNLQAVDGYIFDEEYIISVNGHKEKREVGQTEYDFYYRQYSFLNKIDNIEILGVKEPVIGEAASVDGITVPKSANYSISYVQWCDTEDYGIATEFEEGHTYYLDIALEAKEGYMFAPYARWTAGNSSGTTDYFETTYVTFSTDEYSFKKVIDKVEVTNLPTCKVGDIAKVDISIPKNVNYEAIAEWYVWNDDIQSYEFFEGTFENGKTYELGIFATAKDGYRFDEEETAFYLDGKQEEPTYIFDGYLDYFLYYPSTADKVIEKIEITVDKPIEGDHSSIKPNIKIPENAGYEVLENEYSEEMATWLINLDGGTAFSGYFEEGIDYGIRAELIAKKGYVFAEDLVVIVNGVALSRETFEKNMKYLGINYLFSMECAHAYADDSEICMACGFNNTATTAPEKESVPNTGDKLPIELAYLFVLLSAIVIIAMRTLRHKII